MDDVDAAEEWGVSVKVAERVRATVGADSEAGRAVIDSFEARFPVPDGQYGR